MAFLLKVFFHGETGMRKKHIQIHHDSLWKVLNYKVCACGFQFGVFFSVLFIELELLLNDVLDAIVALSRALDSIVITFP